MEASRLRCSDVLSPKVDCSEIWRTMEAEFFLPRYVRFFSRDVPVEYAKSVELLKANGHPPKDMIPQYEMDHVAYEVVKAHYDSLRMAYREGGLRHGRGSVQVNTVESESVCM
ncbi:hypothetical protein L227DRAFT_303971 [Lentinus tigrinus ALCF2SS1-6]|uniref:Uncharacterized protein n=1 Tax=Lentinus tigrinus ALCF2SS1-6 TaxID=1328759 RepID=A0A5C2RX17_9APHY|nr:hypothetical protein L227DRAFT_303971 [Lentinus tigrinus ALCF2SS1-6]